MVFQYGDELSTIIYLKTYWRREHGSRITYLFKTRQNSFVDTGFFNFNLFNYIVLVDLKNFDYTRTPRDTFIVDRNRNPIGFSFFFF